MNIIFSLSLSGSSISIAEHPVEGWITAALVGDAIEHSDQTGSYRIHPGYWEFVGEAADRIGEAAYSKDSLATIKALAIALLDADPFAYVEPEEGATR